MNQQQGITSQMSAWMAPGGTVDPNLFRNHSTSFSQLPHEAASLYTLDDQSLNDATWTGLAPYDATSAATWSKGLKIDATNGYIYVTGIERETVLLIHAWVSWAEDTTGDRGLRWKSDDGSGKTVWAKPTGVGGEASKTELTHIRVVSSAQTYYYIQGYQSSGGALNCIDKGFVVVRLR
jgi:hypothetical protein